MTNTNVFDITGKQLNTNNLQAAVREAKLDWTVEKRQLYDLRKENGQTIANPMQQWATFRTDTNQPLGFVGKDYHVVQNFDKFMPLNSLFESNPNIRLTNAGELKGGALVYAQMSLPDSFSYEIKGDKHTTKLTIQGSHDGSTKICLGITDITIICCNTYRRALKDSLLNIKHTAGAEERLNIATVIIEETVKEAGELRKVLSMLANKMMTKEKIQEFLNVLQKGDGTKAKNIREKIESLDGSNGNNDLKGTAYDWFNRVTDYADHHKTSRARGWTEEEVEQFEKSGRELAAQPRAESAIIGDGNDFKEKGYYKLLEMAKDLPDVGTVAYSIPSGDGKQIIELEQVVPVTWSTSDGSIGFDPKALLGLDLGNN